MKPRTDFYAIRYRQAGDDVEWSDAYHRTGWQWQMYGQKLPLAWEITRGRHSIVLCDRDQWGSTTTNPDFYTGVADPLRNFTWVSAATSLGNGTFETVPLSSGHGISVASMMVARPDNGIGMTGACPNCNAVGTSLYASDWADYINLDADLVQDADPNQRDRIAVVNFSYFGRGPEYSNYDLLARAGMILVASGNNRQGPNSVSLVPGINYPASDIWTPDANDPARDYRIITVGAVRDGDTYSENCGLWNYDGPMNQLPRAISRGPEEFMWNFNYSTGTNKFSTTTNATQRRSDKEAAFMDLTAGTGFTLEADPDGVGGFALATGTSQAAPQVAGICGLMVSVSPYMGVSRGANGLPLDGPEVQRRAYNILTFTADKIDDDGFTNQGIPAPVQPQYVLQTNDPLRRSWAQRMGFGQVNAFRAVAHSIPTKGEFQYTASSSLDLAGTPARNENNEGLMHWGAWRSQGVSVLAAGGLVTPGGDARHENMGMTRMDGSGITFSVGDACVLAIDGILTTNNASGGNLVRTPAGGTGRILMNGYLENVGLQGNTRIADLTVSSSAGTGSGAVSLGSASALCEAYENIRLLNDGRVVADQGTLRLKTGCALQMLGTQDVRATGGGTITMESASTISGSPGRRVVVEAGSYLNIAAGAQADIFADVLVHNGGTFTIGAGANVSIDHFTVEPGGTLAIEQGAHVTLNRPDVNVCQGKLYLNGAAAAHVTLSGRVDSWRDLSCCRTVCTHVNQPSSILVQGSLADVGASFLHIAFADISNVPIRAVTVAKDAITDSKFTGHRSLLAPGTYLLSLELGTTPGAVTGKLVPVYDATVTNCTFLDEAGDLAGPRNTISYPIDGLRLRTLRNVALGNNSFMNLGYCVASNSCVNITATHLTGTGSNIGMYDVGSAVKQCDDWFSGDDYCAVYYGSKIGTAYSNTFRNTRWAVVNWNSGAQNFRGNLIGDYKIGMYTIDGPLNLAPQAATQYGRNVFSAGAITPPGPYPPSLFGNAAPVDIQMSGTAAAVRMECGRNDMASTSWLHLNNLGPVTKTVAAGTNKWNSLNGGFAVRRSANIIANGAPLNVSQSALFSCSNLPEVDQCTVTGGIVADCPNAPYYNDGTWGELPAGGSAIDSVFAAAHGVMTDQTASPICRRIAMRDALYAARLNDSVEPLLRRLVGDYAAITHESSVVPHLAAHALMLRSEAELVLGDPDSADADYRRVVLDYPATPDSIPAVWGLLHLQALADPIASDAAYHDRVLADLRRVSDRDEVLLRPAVRSFEAVSGDAGALLGDIVMNPGSQELTIPYRIPADGRVLLALYDIDGRLIHVMADRDEKAGAHGVSLSTAGLPSGTYVCRLSFGGRQVARTFAIAK
ncbi:MAG TPA: S8 family serine peptidase [Candidatus Kapabacteria bacterium]|nr:S8 family serine peptidase [Candidatus Kapabacteria bacterium]